MEKQPIYALTEQQRLEIIKLLDELILPGKFVRPLTNFFEQMQPMAKKNEPAE